MRAPTLVAAALVVVLAVSACGSSKRSANQQQSHAAARAVSRAATKTVEAGGERVRLNGAMEIQGHTVKLVGTGAFSKQEGATTLVMKLPPAAVEQVHVKTIPMRVVVQGLVVYVKLPKSLSGAKTPWIKVDRSIRSDKVILNEQILTQIDQADASQMLQLLRGTTKAKRLGQATVNGVRTTHYHAVMNLNTAPNALPIAERATAQRGAAGLIRTTGFDHYPADVWVGRDGLIHRMKFSIAFPTSAGTTNLAMQVDLDRFGTHVTATPPPRNLTTDATSLQGQGYAG